MPRAAHGASAGGRPPRSAADGAPAPAAPPAAAPRHAAIRRIDVHTHIGPDGIPRALRLMDEWGIDGVVNLSGMYPGPPRNMLETQLGGGGQAAAAASRCS